MNCVRGSTSSARNWLLWHVSAARLAARSAASYGTRTVRTLRTSIVTDPPDGRIPPLTPAASEIKRRRAEAQKHPASAEETGLQDQCLAFATAGPPMLPYSYNSNYQIVQTRDAVVVHVEMIHDARIIHMDGRAHLSPDIRRWMGDSIGRWEGRTLVVDTTNFNDAGGIYGDAGGNFAWDRNLHLVERFSLLDADTLLYQFEIDDRVHAAMERRADDGAVGRADLRIRLPRSQLLAGEHAEGLPRVRARAGRPATAQSTVAVFAFTLFQWNKAVGILRL